MRRDFRAHFHKERSEKILLNDRMNFFFDERKKSEIEEMARTQNFSARLCPSKITRTHQYKDFTQ